MMRNRYKKEKEKLRENYIDKWIENQSEFQKLKGEVLKRIVIIINVTES
jgi:hypothetical protein